MFEMEVPGIRLSPWYVREVWPAVVGLIVVVVAGGGAILKQEHASKPDQAVTYWLITGLAAGVFLGVIKLAQSVHKDAAASRLSVPWDLAACLLVIHRTLAARKGFHRARPKPIGCAQRFIGWMGPNWNNASRT